MALYQYSRQPVKGLYLLYQLCATLFIRIPVWVLLALPKSNRPRPSWSIGCVVRVRLLKLYMGIVAQTGPFGVLPNHLDILPGVGFQGVWIPPASDKLLIGVLKTYAEQNQVDRVKIPGYWIHKKNSDAAFGHPSDFTANITRGFLEEVPSVQRAFSVEYRLSKLDANPFPAALLDGIAAYDYLVNVVGYDPSDIIVEGDSAGGNLALALTRYLVEYKALTSGTGITNLKSDYVSGGEESLFATKVFCGSLGVEAAQTNRYISPASLDPRMKVDFKDFPRTFIVCGGAEVLADVIRTLRNKMVEDIGEKVTYFEAPDAIHDYLAFPGIPERRETYKAISVWIEAGEK
ncbi:alpha/beta-hydrolase [Hymenopellis radicata]|nr:alpha/beta-hydrolase [Hymenopellis radicata]